MAATNTTEQSLYLTDETAWLEKTAQHVDERRFDLIDCDELKEFLSDMAKRDRRESQNRLAVLLTHLLKWDFQVENRSNSWKGSILTQQRELEGILDSGTLRRHAEEVLDKVYQSAVKQAAAETGLSKEAFPTTSPWTLAEAVGRELD